MPKLEVVPDPTPDEAQENSAGVGDPDPSADADGSEKVPPAKKKAPGKVPPAKKKAAPAKAAAPKPVPEPEPLEVGFVDFEGEKDFVNVMYYGDGGSGKTVASASMARLGRILYINAESGLKRRPIETHGIPLENIKVWRPTDKDGKALPLTYSALDKLYWALSAELHDDPNAWTGIVWDSVTEIHKKLLENVVVDEVAKAERKGVERDPFFTDRADYGKMTEQMRQLVRKYRDLPCHFAITALVRRDVDQNSGEVERGPAITPALQNDLFGYLDMVLKLDITTVDGVDDFRGLSRPLATYQAKDRFGVLPRYLIDTSFDRLVGYATGDLTVDNDPIMNEAKDRRRKVKEAEAATAAAEA